MTFPRTATMGPTTQRRQGQILKQVPASTSMIKIEKSRAWSVRGWVLSAGRDITYLFPCTSSRCTLRSSSEMEIVSSQNHDAAV